MENYLQEEYKKFCNKYGEDRILWIAAVPDCNGVSLDFTINTPVTACYLPTEEELYNINIYDNKIIDIRTLISTAIDTKTLLFNSILSPYKIINPKYKEYINDEFFTYLKIIILDNDEIIINKMKNIIKNIIQVNINNISQEQEIINILTKTELKVLSLIIQDFNGLNEGNIKVSQATEYYKISTSVFRTLFYKLKEYGVAEIDSRGVKGTHIIFRNISTLKSLLDK